MSMIISVNLFRAAIRAFRTGSVAPAPCRQIFVPWRAKPAGKMPALPLLDWLE
jgi:hypothetical protein